MMQIIAARIRVAPSNQTPYNAAFSSQDADGAVPVESVN